MPKRARTSAATAEEAARHRRIAQNCARIAPELRPELRARIARPKSRAPQIALKHIVGTWSEYESTQHFDVITAIESRIDTRLR